MGGRPALSSLHFLMFCLLLTSRAISFCSSGSFSKICFQYTVKGLFPYAWQDIKCSKFSSNISHITQFTSLYFHSFNDFMSRVPDLRLKIIFTITFQANSMVISMFTSRVVHTLCLARMFGSTDALYTDHCRLVVKNLVLAPTVPRYYGIY